MGEEPLGLEGDAGIDGLFGGLPGGGPADAGEGFDDVAQAVGIVLGAPGGGVGALQLGAEAGSVDLAAGVRVGVRPAVREASDAQQKSGEQQAQDASGGSLGAGDSALSRLSRAEVVAWSPLVPSCRQLGPDQSSASWSMGVAGAGKEVGAVHPLQAAVGDPAVQCGQVSDLEAGHRGVRRVAPEPWDGGLFGTLWAVRAVRAVRGADADACF
ncbi:hypothetical protein [Streptomyces sp. ME19-01-6]|uniref:hypothetical protein n=1 Tax=Streptomyces sp. ME19-01-6 TaxID=3028686 RepID=UPI0029CA2366|nr:hypothetical protein [Streptomyces sp. ME19-01-6]